MAEINGQVEETSESAAQAEETETTDWKAKAIEFETKYKAENGTRRRLEKDLKQKADKPNTETQSESQPQDKKGFDYGELAYLEAKGISDPEDQEFTEQAMKDSGKDLKTLLNSKWFQAELKERKDLRMSEGATPPGSKRSGNGARDQVEYWIAKGELPPADQIDLRRKVVNARIAAKKKSHFAPQAVTGNAG